MGLPLTEDRFAQELRSAERTAYRLELQLAYDEPMERVAVAQFLARDPHPPTEVEGLRLWFDQVRRFVERGGRMQRVRVQEEVPTGYQRWERWIEPWNAAAGETIRYLTRSRAYAVGLLPAAGNTDFWLLDDERLIVMSFDERHRRIHNELVTDHDRVAEARTWWHLALRHSIPNQAHGAVTA